MNQRSNVKLGIVGCGRVAEECHIPAALSASNVELVAVVDSSPERLEYIEGSFRLSCLATTSCADLYGKVDAVLLLLPNHLHYPVGCEFLKAGIHVLCEKPLANSAREATALCELAETTGVVLGVGYMKRFEPNFDLMKRLIDEGFLGKLDSFTFEYGSTGSWAPLSSYNLQRNQAGGGVLMTNGCHFLDRMLCWFGWPSSLTFSDDSHGGVEANCSAFFAFESGLTGEVSLSKTQSLRNRFRLHGERGCIEIKNSQHDSVTFFPAGQRALRHEISECPGREALPEVQYFRLQIEDFAHAIQSGTHPRVTGRQGILSVALIEQCYQTRSPLPESWVFDSLPMLHHGSDSRASLKPAFDVQNEHVSLPGVQSRFRSISDDSSGEPQDAVELAGRWRPAQRAQTERSVLVTGSTGFVGSRLCEVLHLSTDYEPRPFVRSSGTGSYIARYPLDFAMGDLTDLASVRRAMEGCSLVVHLARGSNRVMINGLENVLRAAVDARVSRFIHVSSVAVYGNNPPPSAEWETARASKTGNAYGDIKLEQERLVASYGRRFGLPFVILRPPHILGPFSHFVNTVTQRLQDGALPILGDGLNVCNLVYIDNLIEAILLSLERPEAVGETFFITDKERVTWRKCLEDFGAMLGVSVPHATAAQLDPPVLSGTGDSLRRMARLVLSREFRSAVMGIPPIGTVGRLLYDGYASLPARQQNYIRWRLRPPSVPDRRQPGPPRYDAAHHLIAAQRRKVVHACDKAERILGYTAPVGYSQAMAMTQDWLQFARVIPKATSDHKHELAPVARKRALAEQTA